MRHMSANTSRKACCPGCVLLKRMVCRRQIPRNHRFHRTQYLVLRSCCLGRYSRAMSNPTQDRPRASGRPPGEAGGNAPPPYPDDTLPPPNDGCGNAGRGVRKAGRRDCLCPETGNRRPASDTVGGRQWRLSHFLHIHTGRSLLRTTRMDPTSRARSPRPLLRFGRAEPRSSCCVAVGTRGPSARNSSLRKHGTGGTSP